MGGIFIYTSAQMLRLLPGTKDVALMKREILLWTTMGRMTHMQ